MNILDAEKAAAERNRVRTEVFCPLLRAHCVIECEAYVSAQPNQSKLSDGTKTWNVMGGYCESPLMHGITYPQNY